MVSGVAESSDERVLLTVRAADRSAVVVVPVVGLGAGEAGLGTTDQADAAAVYGFGLDQAHCRGLGSDWKKKRKES